MTSTDASPGAAPAAAPTDERDTSWNVRDTIAIAAVTGLAAVVRLFHLSRPSGFVFDEFYAADACWYVHGSASLCRTAGEVTVVHPPLGKWLIGLGIRLFGFGPGGWRIASAAAGILTVAAVYLLARKLLRSTIASTAAAGLVALDFLHVVLSRTAMLDVFVTGFAVAAFLCLAYDWDAAGRTRRPAGWGLHRPWRVAAGLAAGGAAATKWSGWPFLAAILVVTVLREIDVRAGVPQRLGRVLREEGPSVLMGLLILPLLVYTASYAGRVDGSLLAWPWADGSWVRAFIDRQAFMLHFHLGLGGTHPYASPAWSWPLLKRPVLFFFTVLPDGRYQEILALGNPLAWWASVPALGYLALNRDSAGRAARTVILAGFLAGFVPWLALTGAREQTFLYLMLPAVPFMCLALGAAVARMGRSRLGLAVVGVFAALAVATFLFFRPLLMAEPLPYREWRSRILFDDCSDGEGARLRPATRPGPPPAGWCWA